MKCRWFFAVFILLSCTVSAQTKWELCKDKNGIKVYSAKEGTSKFKSVRVEATLTGTLDKLLRLLMDAGSNKEWIYRTEESYVLQRFGPHDVLSYTQTSVPWPASNRDIPIRIKTVVDPQANTLKVYAAGVPNAIPPKKGVVRIPYFNSSWDVKFDGQGKLHIQYTLQMDPGGSIPAWITNMFVAKGPYETFDKLRELLD